MKIYMLVKHSNQIMDCIENDKKNDPTISLLSFRRYGTAKRALYYV